MEAYQGQNHWQTQKDLMLQQLIKGGKSPDEAQAIVAQITALQQGAGNIPQKHPDSGMPIASAPGTPHPPNVQVPINEVRVNALRKPMPSPMAPPPAAPPSVAPAPSPVVAANPPPSPSITEPEQPSIFDNPEAVSKVLGMGDLNRQMAFADKVRGKASPEGRYSSSGRIYTAASPFEHMGTAYEKYMANKQSKNLAGQQLDAKKAIIEALRGKKTAPPSASGGGVMF